MVDFILYFVVQLILTIVTTVKYVVTVKASPAVAAMVTSAAAVISGIGTKLLTALPMWQIIIALAVASILGVFLGRLVVDKFTKDRLWVYNATIKDEFEIIENIRTELKVNNVHSMYDMVAPKMYILKVFAESREASKITKTLLNSTKNCKYHIIESR